MADIRELVQQAAPRADALDVDAVRARAQAVRARDQRRQRLAFGAVTAALVVVVALVASPLVGGDSPRGGQVAVGQDTVTPGEQSTAIIDPLPTATDHPMVVVPPSSPGDDGMHVDPSPKPYPDEGMRSYEVRVGDTLTTIAEAVYGDHTAFGLIAEANELTGDRALEVGQILTIPPYPDPDGRPTASSGEENRTYQVQPGDTLSSIAEAVYGDPTAFGLIAAANGLDGDAPMFVGQWLVIPPNPDPEGRPTPVPLTTASAVDPAIEAALRETAPSGWDPQPSAAGSVAAGNGDGGIRVVEVVVPDGQTAEQVVQQAIDGGEGSVELPDGALGSFRNPPATHGRLLVPLPGNRLIEITGEGDRAGTLDYELGALMPWMADLRAALG